jgi:hypothetical protein
VEQIYSARYRGKREIQNGKRNPAKQREQVETRASHFISLHCEKEFEAQYPREEVE